MSVSAPSQASSPLFVFGLPLLLCLAALSDLRWRQIPNVLSLVLAVGGLLFRWADTGPSAMFGGIGLGVVVFGIGFVLQLLRFLGGGDVKLLAATAVWLTPSTMWTALAGTAIAGGMLGLAFLSRSGAREALSQTVSPDETLLERLQLPDGDDSAHVPYAVAIAIGCLWAWAVQLGFLSGGV